MSLGFGQTVNGSLDAVGELDAYTFPGEAGDRVRVQMSTPDRVLDSQIELLDAQGVPLAEATADQTFESKKALFDFNLTSGGTFTLLVGDIQGDETGAYAVTLQRLNNPG